MIREMRAQDQELYLAMTEEFYHSAAVLHPVAPELREATFQELLRSDRYVDGVVLEDEGEPVGYALLAKTFSQEVGGLVVWIEELYLRPACRGRGLGGAFFTFLRERYPEARRFRLELTRGNDGARRLYERQGFEELDYLQMVLDL